MRFAPPRASYAPGYTALMARGHVDEREDVRRGMAEERSCLAPRREPLNVICNRRLGGPCDEDSDQERVTDSEVWVGYR